MEKFLFYFGVHQYFVGHTGDQRVSVDLLQKPLLTHQSINLSQRNHVLTLKTCTRAHAQLVLLLQSHLVQVFDQRDEYVLGVVFLKSEMRVAC
jgi:hypothetical protein